MGGSGGLGQALCRMLVERGARHLVILSRTAQSRKYIDFYADLRTAGCEVVARNCSVSDRSDLQRVLRQCAGMPPIKGIIQGAMALSVSQSIGVCYVSLIRVGLRFRIPYAFGVPNGNRPESPRLMEHALRVLSC